MTKVRQKQGWNSAVGTAIPANYDDTLAAGVALETSAVDLLDDLNGLRSQVNRLIHGSTLVGGDNWYDFDSTVEAGVEELALATRLCSTRLIETITLSAAATVVVLDNSGPPDESPTVNMAIGSVTTEGAVCAALAGAVGGGADLTAVVPSTTGIAIQPRNLCTLIDMSTGEVLVSGGKQIFGLLQVASTAVDDTPFPTTATSAQLTLCEVNGTATALIAPSTPVPATTIQYFYNSRLEVQNLPEDCSIAPQLSDNTASVDVTRQNAYANQGTTPVDITATATLDLEGPGVSWIIRDDLEAALFSITEGSAGGTSAVTIADDVDTFTSDATVNDFDNGISVDTGAAGTTIGIGTTANTITSGGLLALDPTGDVDVTLIAGEALDIDQAGNETNAIITMRSSSTFGTDKHGLFSGDGDPNTVVAALSGSLFLDDTGAVYVNTSGADTVGSTWTALSTGSVENRQNVYDNQAGTVVTMGAYNATLDIASGQFWEIGDAASASILRITESSGTNLTTFAVDADAINLIANQPTGTGTGGAIDIIAGVGGTGNDAGGSVDIAGGGGGTTNGPGGAVNLDGGAGAGSGVGGPVTIEGGVGGSDSGQGGDVTMAAGNGGVTNGLGGNVAIDAGAGAGVGTDGDIEIGQNNSRNTLIAASLHLDLTSAGTAADAIDINSSGGIDIDAASTTTITSSTADTTAVVSLETTGTGGDLVGLFTGTSSPNLRVNATTGGGGIGSLFLDGTNADAWINTDGATAWSQLAIQADITRQLAYNNQNTAVVDLLTNATLEVGTGLTWIIRDEADKTLISLGTESTTTLQASDASTATGSGTGILIDAGAGGATSGAGGNIDISAGDATTAGTGGVVTITGGNGGATSGDGEGVILRGGTGGGADGSGGGVDLIGGTGGTTDGAGGTIAIDAGPGTGTGADGDILIGQNNALNVAVQASGTTNTAITVTATAGGIDVSAVGLIDIESTSSGVTINGNSNATLGLGGVEITTDSKAGATDIYIAPGNNIGEGIPGTDIILNPGAGGTQANGHGRVQIFGDFSEDDSLLRLDSTEAFGTESMDVYIGTTSPDGVVSAPAGSTKYVDDGTTGELWINTTPGNVDGTQWEKVETSPPVSEAAGKCDLVKGVANVITASDATLTVGGTSPFLSAGLDPKCIRLDLNGVVQEISDSATGTLTFTLQPVNGDTVTLGATTYTFRTSGTFADLANEVVIGNNLSNTIENLRRAINLEGGAGSLYGTPTVVNASAFATSTTTTLVAEAKNGGTGGNTIASTTTVTGASWGGATLGGGVDYDFRYNTGDGVVTWMASTGTAVDVDGSDRVQAWNLA